MTDKQDAKTIRSVARLRRLAPMLETRLDDATAALELLIAEAEIGEPRTELWEHLHAAAARDERDVELGTAYEQAMKGRRLKTVTPAVQAEILMHGADFFQGILGDLDGAANFLTRVLAIVPDHADAFARLERKYTASHDDRRLAELYVSALASRPDPPTLLIGRVLAIIERLQADAPLGIEVCERLMRTDPKSPRVRAVLEAHCRKTGRPAEAAALLEIAIADPVRLDPPQILEVRRRLLALYMGEAKAPDASIPHVEALLLADPANAEARKIAERLLTQPRVAARAAAALQESRRRMPH